MFAAREWPGKVGQWQRAEKGGDLCGRLSKSSGGGDEQL